ncbi:MAG: hypothetical protein JWM73_1062 [Solirubrobacterales bacterium]|nr:hypothetical protein [Solirubrobacterales bacterium]
MRAVGLIALAIGLAAVAVPAQGDRFLSDPESCHHTTHHRFHHANGTTTDIRVTYTSQRFTSCAGAIAVANSWASTAGCHDTRYCQVYSGSYSCHNKFYPDSRIAHCQALHGASGEVFLSWHRVG